MPAMNYAVKITANGQRGGQKVERTGWLIYNANGGRVCFVDANGRGEQALTADFKLPVMVLCAVPATATYFRECQRGIDHPYYMQPPYVAIVSSQTIMADPGRPLNAQYWTERQRHAASRRGDAT